MYIKKAATSEPATMMAIIAPPIEEPGLLDSWWS